MWKILHKTIEVSGLTLISRVLGLARDMLIAGAFGASLYSDAFFMAFRPFDLLRKMFSDGIMSISFIPVFSRYLERSRIDQARAMLISALILVIGLSLVLVFTGLILAPALLAFFAPGFSQNPAQFDLSVVLLRIMMPYLMFIMLMSLGMGILNSFGRFALPAGAPILFNLVIIFFTLASVKFFKADIRLLALGVTFAGLCQAGVMVPFVIKALTPFPFKFCLLHPGMAEVGKTIIPAMLGAATFQINVMAASFFASVLTEGSVSFLYYSDRLVQFPLALFGGAFSAVLLPFLSKKAVSKQLDQVSAVFENGVCLVMFITIPAMAGLMALSHPLVMLFFNQGAFGAQAVSHTAACLNCLVLGLWAFAGTRLFVTLHYALSNIWYPFFAGIVTIAVNVVLCLMLVGSMGYQGLALAVSLSGGAGFFFLFFKLPKGMYLSRIRILVSACRAVLVSGIMVFPVGWTAGWLVDAGTGRLGMGLGVLGCVCMGMAIVFGMAVLIKAPEITLIKELIIHKRP